MNRFLKVLLGKESPSRPGRSTGGAYTVDRQDSVQPLADFPESSAGAPMPIVLASEHSVFVVFYLQTVVPKWDGPASEVVSNPKTDDEAVAVVRFDRPRAHFFGPPNDEAFYGHPLAARGLKPYGAFEVKSSSWIRALERMNSVHPRHRPEIYSSRRHFILTFHDSIFECVANGFTTEQPAGSMGSIVSKIAGSL